MNEITMIPIVKLEHHPKNPRGDLGDLSELSESIRNRGIMQNLTVVPGVGGEGYLVVIGNRRLEAARAAGLTELPCVISDMDEKEQMATMLMENMQRQDLTVYEQAQGFQMMMDLGFTAKEIGEKTGFSETTVRNRIKLTKFRKKDFAEACERGATLMDFMELDKIEDSKARYEVMMAAGTADFRSKLTLSIKNQEFRKNEARVKAYMKDLHMKELPSKERYSNKWEDVVTIDLETPDEKITQILNGKLKADETYCWEINRYYGRNGRLDIRRAAKHTSALTDAEKERRAISRRNNDHCRKVKAFYRQAFELRRQFVREYALNTQREVINMAYEITHVAVDQKNSWDDKLPANHLWNDQYIRETLELPEKAEGKTIYDLAFDKDIPMYRVLLAWALGGGVVSDSPEIGWYDRSNGDWDGKDRWQTQEANDVYSLLTLCGYQMSELEKQLKDGTHECYQWDE